MRPGYSDNPHNDTRLVTPKEGHPVTRGVKPFRANDEWYFKIRFRPIRPSRHGRPDRRQNLVGHDKQDVHRAASRRLGHRAQADGGRVPSGSPAPTSTRTGRNADFRKLVLNAVLWTAKLEVPESGVEAAVGDEELSKNLDKK